MMNTMEGVLKLPYSFRIIKPNPKRTNRAFRTVPSASASVTVASPNPILGPGSLGHLTRPDFPILHQALSGFVYSILVQYVNFFDVLIEGGFAICRRR